MIDGFNFFDQGSKNNLITYDNITKTGIRQRDDYTTGCLLDYSYFNSYYKIIAIELCKQQAIVADPKAIQQINFTGNLNWSENLNDNIMIFFISVEFKETILDFSQGTAKIL